MWLWANRLHTAVIRDGDGVPQSFCRATFHALSREQRWCDAAFWPLLVALEQGLYDPLPASGGGDDGEGLSDGE